MFHVYILGTISVSASVVSLKRCMIKGFYFDHIAFLTRFVRAK